MTENVFRVFCVLGMMGGQVGHGEVRLKEMWTIA